jgi:hypothetical protein
MKTSSDPFIRANIVPGNGEAITQAEATKLHLDTTKSLNLSAYKILEGLWAKGAVKGIKVEIDLIPDGTNVRPKSFRVTVKIKSKAIEFDFPNHAGNVPDSYQLTKLRNAVL